MTRYYHIEIAQERRSPTMHEVMGEDRSRLAHTDGAALWCMSDADFAEKDWSDDQFVSVASWDLQAPYVILHKGGYTPRFAGWPELTKEEYDALPRPDPL